MGFIILTCGLMLYFGTAEGLGKCGENTGRQMMWFFTETWMANCSTIKTWYAFGIVSAVVGTVILIATVIAKLTQ